MKESNFDMRITLLEEKIMWNDSILIKMDQKFDRMEERLVRLEGRLEDVQIRLGEKISELQARTDARFIEMAHEFNGVHREIAAIHRGIALQTRWILSVILFATVMGPVILKLLDRYL